MYRRQRIGELKQEEDKARFGRVYPIGREDYTREVTEASKVNELGDDEERGTGVICFLYKDGYVCPALRARVHVCVSNDYVRIVHSERATAHMNILASRYPRSKFVSIVGDKCIPNLPDSRLPMIIVYRKGDIRNQVTAWGSDRERRVEGAFG
jgi:hypothetical protein